ncbi:MAG: hypothetical protein P8X39_12620, partial [Desulfofustis sp.]
YPVRTYRPSRFFDAAHLDAPSTITRLRDMGLEPFLIGSSINAVLAQRLVRRICPSCKEHYRPNPEELERIGLSTTDLINGLVSRGRGCETCLETGYRGRTGIHEFMLLDEELKRIILETSDAAQLKKHACGRGMRTLLQDGANRVLKGETTVAEVYRVAQS